MDKNKIRIPDNIKISEPLGYLDFLFLESASAKILTDSGGIQKEAYLLRKPCITIRSETEWTETVDDGWNILADPGDDGFTDMVKAFNPKKEQSDVFGRDVGEKMVDLISKILKD